MSMKQKAYLVLVLLIAGISALGGALAGGLVVYQITSRSAASANQAGVDEISNNAAAPSVDTLVVKNTDVETSVTQVVQQIGPAVVTVVGTVPGQRTFFGRSAESQVSGSGVFITEDGYILTNNHVVEDATNLTLILADGSQQPAELVGADIYADLAVLKTSGPAPAFANLGNSDSLDPGETVIAIGSPLGDFMNSVTVGVVSATGRSIDTGYGYQIEGLIQTDAAINEGNSGGPLVNLAGEVVGINTLVVRSSGSGNVAEGLGFAMPSNTAQAVASQIIETGRFSRPYLGLQWQAITPNIARMYRLPVEWGVYVTDVVNGSPADQAGIQSGDIITQVGEFVLNESQSYINALFEYQPGDQVTIGLVRNGQLIEVQVVLNEA